MNIFTKGHSGCLSVCTIFCTKIGNMERSPYLDQTSTWEDTALKCGFPSNKKSSNFTLDWTTGPLDQLSSDQKPLNSNRRWQAQDMTHIFLMVFSLLSDSPSLLVIATNLRTTYGFSWRSRRL